MILNLICFPVCMGRISVGRIYRWPAFFKDVEFHACVIGMVPLSWDVCQTTSSSPLRWITLADPNLNVKQKEGKKQKVISLGFSCCFCLSLFPTLVSENGPKNRTKEEHKKKKWLFVIASSASVSRRGDTPFRSPSSSSPLSSWVIPYIHKIEIYIYLLLLFPRKRRTISSLPYCPSISCLFFHGGIFAASAFTRLRAGMTDRISTCLDRKR